MMCCVLPLLVSTFFGFTTALQVNVTGNWVQNMGWIISCEWRFDPQDRLQSVRWYKNEQQFLIFRPEVYGSTKQESFTSQKESMRIDCVQNLPNSDLGQCVVTVVPHSPPTTKNTYGCEVSGERPFFRLSRKDYVADPFVPPSDAIVVMSKQKGSAPTRATFNCSSSGLPAPTLVWTIDNQQVTADFLDKRWNSVTKLWDVWSFLSATASQEHAVQVTCTPELKHSKAQPAGYILENGAFSLGTQNVLVAVTSLLTLLR